MRLWDNGLVIAVAAMCVFSEVHASPLPSRQAYHQPYRSFYPVANKQVVRQTAKVVQEKWLQQSVQTHTFVQKSWLSSMILPGLGQFYHGHYWKMLCIYGGAFTFFGKSYSEHKEMQKYGRMRLLSLMNKDRNDTSYPDVLYIDRRVAECKRARNLFAILLGAWYILNILDAYASGHDKTVNFVDDIGTPFAASNNK